MSINWKDYLEVDPDSSPDFKGIDPQHGHAYAVEECLRCKLSHEKILEYYPKLTQAHIDAVRAWIADGSPWTWEPDPVLPEPTLTWAEYNAETATNGSTPDMVEKPEAVDHPPHYQTAAGIEAIDVIDAFGLNFNLGNAAKYILRAGKKGDALEDLEKSIWYIRREVTRREKEASGA